MSKCTEVDWCLVKNCGGALRNGQCDECKLRAELAEGKEVLDKAGYRGLGSLAEHIKALVEKRDQRFDRLMQVCGENEQLRSDLAAFLFQSEEVVPFRR